jgi:nicotinamidase-related amidase
MLISRAASALLIIDVQEKLLPAIDQGPQVFEHTEWLLRLAQKLGVPVAASEQYPQGLGPTVPALRERLPADAIAAKTHFSCVAAACLPVLPGGDRKQRVLAGIEAHVCVLQTALGLLRQGCEVYVVEEAVGSRRASDRQAGLARLRQEGVRIVSREMVAFEWLEAAGTAEFKDVSKAFLR